MITHHQLSNGTWGRVLALRDTATGASAPRPKDGAMRTEYHIETNIAVEWTPADPEIAAKFGTQRDVLPSRTYSRQVPDIDPQWQAWLDAGLITDEVLADVPEPDESVAARQVQTALAQREQAWNQWAAAGYMTSLGFKVPLAKNNPKFIRNKEKADTYTPLFSVDPSVALKPIKVEAIDGTLHDCTVGQLLQESLAIGQAVAGAWEAYDACSVAIKAATDQDGRTAAVEAFKVALGLGG